MKLVLCLVVLVCLLFVSVVCAAPLPLVTDGKSDYVLYVKADAPTSVTTAAADLQSYLQAVTGAKLPIVEAPRSPMIAVGVPAPGPETPVALEGYRQVTQGRDLYLFGPDTAEGAQTPQGGTSNGTANGVYAFIEEFLGVRWLMPGEHGDYVPTKPTVTVPELNRTEAPFFLNRRLPYTQERTAATKQWWARQRLGLSLSLYHSHNWQHFTMADFKAHPEWFAERGGVRMAPVGDRFKLCTTNDGLVREFARRAVLYFDQNPTATCYSLSPTDSAGWCECAHCKALYEQDPNGELSVTPAVIDFYNRVAQIVAVKYPQKTLAGYIYAQYVYPPSKSFTLAPNMFLVWAPSFDYGFTLYRPDIQKQWDDLVPQWLKVTRNISYYDLPNCVHNEMGAINPPGLKILKWLYPRLAQAEMKGVYVYGAPAWGYAGPMNYLLAKLAWNPRADVDALFDDYLRCCYAEGAAELKQFYTLLDEETERHFNADHKASYSLNEPWLRAVYAKNFPELERLYRAAEAKIKDPEAKARLAMLGVNLNILHWNLRQQKLLEKPEQSSFYLSDRDFFACLKPWSGSLAIAPSQSAGKLAAAKVTVRTLSVANPEPVTPYLLRGDQRVLLKPLGKDPVVVSFSQITSRGKLVKYTVYDAAGTPADQGVVSQEMPVTLPTGGDYYWLGIAAGSASFALEVKGAAWALQADEQGLHFLGKTTPLYFEVPAGVTQFDLLLASDAPGETGAAKLYAPDGKLAASFRTVEKSVDSQEIKVGADQAGLWKIVFETPEKGVVDDLYVRVGEQLSGFLSPMPQQVLAVDKAR